MSLLTTCYYERQIRIHPRIWLAKACLEVVKAIYGFYSEMFQDLLIYCSIFMKINTRSSDYLSTCFMDGGQIFVTLGNQTKYICLENSLHTGAHMMENLSGYDCPVITY